MNVLVISIINEKERKKDIFCWRPKFSSGDIISVKVNTCVVFCDHLQV